MNAANEPKPRSVSTLDAGIRDYINLRVEATVAAAVEAAFSRHIAELRDFMQLGFPDGDLDGHRRYHEEQIEMMKARRKMYESIAEKTLTGLLWAVLVAIGAAIWEYMVKRIH